MTFIAIEGVIGVGKTTLARYLHQATQNSTLMLEVFEENPFLSKFYQDRERYAFQTQIFFLLSRYQQLKHMVGDFVISDYMFAKDSLFAHLNLHGDELATYNQVHHALAEHIATPDLVVYLRADTAALMERITLRDRSYERDMEVAYIDRLRHAYEDFFAQYNASPVMIVDTSDAHFVLDEAARNAVIQRILSTVHQPPLPGID
jgi:deoxyadenosine/deoxycytidine kinase